MIAELLLGGVETLSGNPAYPDGFDLLGLAQVRDLETDVTGLAMNKHASVHVSFEADVAALGAHVQAHLLRHTVRDASLWAQHAEGHDSCQGHRLVGVARSTKRHLRRYAVEDRRVSCERNRRRQPIGQLEAEGKVVTPRTVLGGASRSCLGGGQVEDLSFAGTVEVRVKVGKASPGSSEHPISLSFLSGRLRGALGTPKAHSAMADEAWT
mmetsp:Transcript_37435/g.94052  ORF Transcript_37435/g.94052 Transcript_37435/m.94052 type:complete len:211 (+) Transcript_37435:919-1551(+)